MPKVNIESRRFVKGKRFTVYYLEVNALTSMQCYFARDPKPDTVLLTQYGFILGHLCANRNATNLPEGGVRGVLVCKGMSCV